MFSKILARMTHRVLALVAGAGTVLVFTTGVALASHGVGVTIEAATWNGSQLTANGKAERITVGVGPVELVDADTNIVIGTDDDVKGNHKWSISTSTCAFNVFARQDGARSIAIPVTGANCGGGNTPPTANDDAYSTPQNTPLSVPAPGVLANDTDPDPGDTVTAVPAAGATSQNGSYSLNTDGSFTYTPPNATFTGDDTFTYAATDGTDNSTSATVTITVEEVGPTARGDTYATPIGKTLNVAASRVSGVLYNDFGGTGALTAVNLDDSGTDGSVTLNANGSFDYTPPGGAIDNQLDTFTYQAQDALGELSAPAIVSVQILSDQPDYKMTMNYELGMHCTGFEFAYCCVLPPYNSIVAQITKPQTIPTPTGRNPSNPAAAFPRLLDASDTEGLDLLNRETVLRDLSLDGAGNFKKYQVKYYHDAQPRVEGQGKPTLPGDTLISNAEGSSLLYHGTRADSAAIGPDGQLVYGLYGGAAYGVWQGDGDFNDPTDNYANAWLNHFYIYVDPAHPTPAGPNLEGFGNTGIEADKIRLGVSGMVEYPANVGASLQPLGPTGSAAPFDNFLTFSTDTGTVVYTQMKVLEDLPVMLTSPRMWEALGLPLTPFEDSINFFVDPGAVDEDTVRPYVAMKAALHEYPSGNAVVGSNGQPVIGFGTAPIDIPNCERCHSAPAINPVTGDPNVNSPSYQKRALGPDPFGDPWGTGYDLEGLTDVEYQYWYAYYTLTPNDSDWYARLKAAAINMMALHDDENGTTFTENYPGTEEQGVIPQNTRLGFESVVCQKCHADNVIAVVKSGCKVDPTSTVLCPDDTGPGTRQIIQPITEAIHWNHRGTDEQGGVITFSDGLGRDGGCQGCHPAHRSDGVTDGYPITLDGDNFQANSDNRLALGGCFVGRDVHSNPLKDVDGAETDEYLNAVGQWLSDNVYNNQAGQAGSDADNRGLWCTNCHNQLGQSIWAAENMVDLINNVPGKEADLVTDAVNIRALPTLAAIAGAVGVSEAQAIAWLDPTDGNGEGDFTHSIWNPDVSANPDANVATIEVSAVSTGCGPRFPFLVPRFGVYACLDLDGDPGGAVPGAGDPSVRILDFCTTPDCVAVAQATLDAEGFGSIAAPVPFDAATDGRDHWLAPGEPHCADCHAAPFTEQSGNLNPFPPFNYPRKASLMRYSRGHQDLTCQSCHESIHGLYPVSPTIDTTSYAQAASLNPDGSHGPLKCATCHEVNSNGVPVWMNNVKYQGNRVNNYEDAVAWAHTFTDNVSVLQGEGQSTGVCTNCHGDRSDKIAENKGKWLRHSYFGRIGRKIQDKAEIEALGHVAGDPDTNGDGINDRDATQIANTVCTACHSLQGGPSGAFLNLATCDNVKWKNHLIQGRLAEKTWEFISESQNPPPANPTCGW